MTHLCRSSESHREGSRRWRHRAARRRARQRETPSLLRPRFSSGRTLSPLGGSPSPFKLPARGRCYREPGDAPELFPAAPTCQGGGDEELLLSTRRSHLTCARPTGLQLQMCISVSAGGLFPSSLWQIESAGNGVRSIATTKD